MTVCFHRRPGTEILRHIENRNLVDQGPAPAIASLN